MKTQSSRDSAPLSRRRFLGVGTALAGASGASLFVPAPVLAEPSPQATVSQKGALPATGVIRDGIYSFKGVPYGADTGGANRWMMAKAPTPWAGVKSTTCYAQTCPMIARAGWNNDEERAAGHGADTVHALLKMWETVVQE